MAPRLYLIVSDRNDHSDLVKIKIGRTDPFDSSLDDQAVIERVRKYSTGISDSATVVQAPGAAIFETWLHQFVEKKKKNITIQFAFRPGSIIKPREWFELSPELAQILADAFTSEPPRKIDDVDIADLPLFLSGAMAVIRWHGENESAAVLAEMAANAEVQTLVNSMGLQQPDAKPRESFLSETAGFPSTADSPQKITAQLDTVSATAHDLLNAPAYLARLRIEMQALEESERLRTCIAMAIAGLVAFIGIFGSPAGAAWFAFLGALLLAFWPNALPQAAKRIVDYLQRDAKAARTRNHADAEEQ